MIKIQILFVFLLLSSYTFAQIPTGYYNGTDGLTGDDLREKLKQIIQSGHTTNDYGDLYVAYQTTDNYVHEGNDAIWDMYSMHNDGTANYWYPHHDKSSLKEGEKCDRCTEGLSFNREHSVPQSWFNSYQPMKADLFIVYPTDGCVNNMRGHHPFGETDSPDWTSTNGSKRGPCSFPAYVNDTNIGNIPGEDNIIFEPIDRFKGDFARTYFYTVTRYKDKISYWTENVAPDVFKYDNLEPWAIELFLKWHREDPVSQKEIDRNNAAFAIQHNRNPYIDHPEWAECIWADICQPLTFTSQPATSVMETQTYTYNITYNVDTDTETLTGTTIPSWLTFTKDESSNTALLTGTATNAEVGTHDVVLTLTEGEETQTQTFTITVLPYSSTVDIWDIDFSTCPPTNWTTYSIASNMDWNCEAQTFSINAYNGNEASNDWFISPEVNLNNYTNEILSFKTWTQYTDTEAPRLKLKYSTDYSGTGDPTSAIWTPISFNASVEDSQAWTNSGNLDLSAINGTNVHIAFQYTSSGTGGGTTTYWKIDDILLSGDIITNISNVDKKIKLYPNPTNNILFVETNFDIKSINIVNILGQNLISENNINKNKTELNVNSLSKGIYLITITDINGNTVKSKFLKK